MGVQEARAKPVTIITPVRPFWAMWLRFSWPGAERAPGVRTLVHRPLFGLRFIHFAHWGLLRRMPQRRGKRLPAPCIVFNSNFNGDINAYLDAFSIVVPWRMRGLWQGAYHFPGPTPLGDFREYVMSRAVPANHYYCAYPEASAKTIASGLKILDDFPELARSARKSSPRDFERDWHRFITRHGMSL